MEFIDFQLRGVGLECFINVLSGATSGNDSEWAETGREGK